MFQKKTLNSGRTAWEKLIFPFITVPKKAELEGENDRVLENRHMLSSDRPIVTITRTSRTNKNVVTVSRFRLVDLAGSERPDKTLATGSTFVKG
jgi:hypothetical protein